LEINDIDEEDYEDDDEEQEEEQDAGKFVVFDKRASGRELERMEKL